MIILGIGSNLGDRLENLRQALQAIKKIPGMKIEQVSPVYISDAMVPENAPPEWNKSFLNAAIICESIFEPADLFKIIKKIETKVGRTDTTHWAPRIVDIDILAWDELTLNNAELTIPHKGLLDRPFALWPLADVAPFWRLPANNKTAAELVEHFGSRFTGDAPYGTKQIYQRIDTPQLVGVVNVTPDSFSDGNKYLIADAAVQQALYLVYSGAEILDLGAESTAPHAPAITPEEEWKRLEPVLVALRNSKNDFVLPPKISIDTRHHEVAAKALAYEIDWINDVTGLQDPAMCDVVAKSKKDCVVMHHVSIPASREHVIPRNVDVVKFVYDWAEKHFAELEKCGIAREKIIFDPGIGFGKTAEQSLALIKNIEEFNQLGTRILVGHSRKSFMGAFTHRPASERDIETLVFSLFLAKQHVDYLRVHNVEMCARGLKVAASVMPA